MALIKIDKDSNVLSAQQYVRATADHTCPCGHQISFQIDWPQNVSMNTQISVSDLACPRCHSPVVLPRAHYFVEDYRLLSKPIETK
ncbi:hypothetical protein L1281_002291 [Neisseria sp. HSC-16F19]|nr:hypothetical protein [Neisseria sp. HSC-16F19]